MTLTEILMSSSRQDITLLRHGHDTILLYKIVELLGQSDDAIAIAHAIGRRIAPNYGKTPLIQSIIDRTPNHPQMNRRLFNTVAKSLDPKQERLQHIDTVLRWAGTDTDPETVMAYALAALADDDKPRREYCLKLYRAMERVGRKTR